MDQGEPAEIETESPTPMIEVSAARKEFGTTVAVAGASFQVARGEIIGLLGPNGSGKTTLIRMICGFFPPTAGRARVAGLDVQSHSLEVRTHIGYLPENVALYPDLTVQRYLSFCAEIKRVPKAQRQERVDSVIADAGLGDVRRKQIGKLSKGYRQRVGIAQALVHAPEILILDEPTVGLDPNHVVEIRQLIRQLRARSTILLSTHILSEAATLCDRVIILHRGRLLANDTAERLQARLETSFQTLVGACGPRDTVLEALRAIPGVVAVEERPATGDDVVRALVTSHTAAVRQIAARVVIENGWTIAEVTPVHATLEDLFVQLVRQSENSNSK